MYKHVIGLRRCRMKNDRAEKLVYTYVNSRMMKRVREYRHEQAVAEAKELPIYALPRLCFDLSSDQDPEVYGSLGHDPLTSIGLDAFVANDHVHELYDIMAGLYIPGHGDDAFEEELRQTSESDKDDQNEEDECRADDDDMDFTSDQEREMDLILERQSKRARAESVVDKENDTPPYRRAAPRRPVDPPSTTISHGLQSHIPYAPSLAHPFINTSTHTHHPFQHIINPYSDVAAIPYPNMNFNLHIANAMQPLPSLHPPGSREGQ